MVNMNESPTATATVTATATATATSGQRLLPADDAQRVLLHDEVHARPSARIRLPALIVLVAVLNEGVSREQEGEHLRRLPGHADLPLDSLQGNFVRLSLGPHTLKWERHTEFTRYSLVQSLPADAGLGAAQPDLLGDLAVSTEWLASIPGRTVAAIQLAMVNADWPEATPAGHAGLMAQAQRWLGRDSLVASQLGGGHSWALTDFVLRADGFERMLVIAPHGTTETRAGRVSQRLLEIETYRLMALRGLPVAKSLSPTLADAERRLAAITAQLENKSTSEQALLDELVSLAAGVEREIGRAHV